MSWNTRRLALGIENAALYLACAALVIYGHPIIAGVALGIKMIDNFVMAADWNKHGRPTV